MISHQISPLRYPGGKGALAPFLGNLLERQPRRPSVFVEPFAGGAGAALRLLVDEYVDEIVLNDLDHGIASFWRAVFGHTEALTGLVRGCSVDIETWHRQREVVSSGSADDVQLGFAVFYLNRTNRSGILDARPIGGLAQTGTWKIDARFNRQSLVDRIEMLGRYRNRVTVLEQDGVDLVRRQLGPRTFIYADPPYLSRGADLYLNAMRWEDHARLARVLISSRAKWMATYDHDPRVVQLYPGSPRVAFSIAHTAAQPHVGQEYAMFSNGLELGGLELLTRRVRGSPAALTREQ